MSNQSAGMNGKETVSRFLEAEAKQDVQGMADVLAEDIVFEMPFALPDLPDRVQGKGTVVEFLEQFLGKDHGMFTGWDLHNIRIYPGGDPDLFFAELDGRGVVVKSGYQYRQKYMSLFRVSDGRASCRIDWTFRTSTSDSRVSCVSPFATEVNHNPNQIRNQNHGDDLQCKRSPARHFDDRKHR